MVDMNEVSQYLQATRGVLDILSTLGGMLPKGEDAEATQKRLEEAERALRASEVQLAKALEYHLCQCTFPPQIMLSKGRHQQYGTEIFACPNCSKQEPSQQFFDQHDRARSFNLNGPRAGY